MTSEASCLMPADLALLNADELIDGQPQPHQAEGLAWLLGHPKALLADSVGLGKTVQAAALLAVLRARDQIGKGNGRVLVVAPAPLLPQWASELGRFVPTLSVVTSAEKRFCNPSKKQRVEFEAEFPNGPDVLVTTAAFLRYRIGSLAGPWAVVILDEASELKASGANFDAAHRVCQTAGRVVALTATPYENNLMETRTILSLLDPPDLWDEATFGNLFVKWQEAYVTPSGVPVDAKPVGVKEDNLPLLEDFLSNYYLRRVAGETVLSGMPEVRREEIWCEPTPPQRSYLAWIRQNIQNEWQRYQLIKKACAFSPDWDRRSAKAEAAFQWLIAHLEVKKVIIWAERLPHLSIMGNLLDAAGIEWIRLDGDVPKADRESVVEIFRDDPDCRVLLGSDVLERGLNLQFAPVLLSLGSTFNPANELQREGRIRRMGSPFGEVQHVYFFLDDPHERRKWALVTDKDAQGRLVITPDDGTIALAS